MFILLTALILLLIAGIPVAYALGLSSLAYFIFVNPDLMAVMPQRVFSGMNNYALM